MNTSRSADVRFFTATVGLMLVTMGSGIFVFMWPELRDYLVARTVVPVPIVAACPTPVSELERMHIVITRRDDKVVAECMFVGSTGTYARSRSPRPRP